MYSFYIAISLPSAPEMAVKLDIDGTYKNKNVEPVLSLVPHPEGSRIALFVETSNAESPTMMYIYAHIHLDNMSTVQYRQNIIRPMWRPRCFVFDEQMNLRDSQDVKSKAYSNASIIYMCHALPALRGLSARL